MTTSIAAKPKGETTLFRAEALHGVRGPEFGSALAAAPLSFPVTAILVTLVAATLIGVLLFGTYTQRETVSGYVAATDGEVRVFPQTAGTVADLLIAEGRHVKAGDPLFSLLTSRNEGMTTDAGREILAEVITEKSALESQAREQLLYFSSEARRLRQVLDGLGGRLATLHRQQELSRRKLAVVMQDVERARRVHGRGHLSARDLDAIELAAIDGELALETTRLRITELEAERQAGESQLAQLEHLRDTRLAEIAEITSRLTQRQTAIRSGVVQEVVAPVDGHVSALHITRGQTVLPDTLALSLLPESARFHAELFVPGRSIAMLGQGSQVQLRFDAYPYEKYGLYGAKVDRIARSLLLPGDARLPVPVVEPVFRVRATLDQQHVLVQGVHRPLAAGLTFKADVLVSERTLLEWMLAPVAGAGRRL